MAAPPTRLSPPASTMGEDCSPARPALVRSRVDTPLSTHTESGSETGSPSEIAGSAPVSPSSPTYDESSNASTTSNPSLHDMRVMDGVLEDLMSLEDFPGPSVGLGLAFVPHGKNKVSFLIFILMFVLPRMFLSSPIL